MPYRLTKGTVSVVRYDEAGVNEAQKRGYMLDGMCDNDGNLTGEAGVFSLQKESEAPTIPPISQHPRVRGGRRGS